VSASAAPTESTVRRVGGVDSLTRVSIARAPAELP
jgi:hypothetical protein